VRPTRPFLGVEPTSRFRSLPPGTSVLDAADAARSAGLAFITMATAQWGRLELAHWLVSAYRPSVLQMRRDPKASGTFQRRSVDEEAVGQLVFAAQQRVIRLILSATRSWNEAGFAREMIDCALVVGVCDENGSLGYAAVDRAEMRLVDRVTSLFVADYLTRPRDYEALVMCAACGVPSFRWDRMHSADCASEAVPSGIVVKREHRHDTSVGVGERALRVVGK
jgi:hypothetical protein